MEYLLRDLYNRYNKPLMITENGLGAYDIMSPDGKIHDDYRIAYLKSHIQARNDSYYWYKKVLESKGEDLT